MLESAVNGAVGVDVYTHTHTQGTFWYKVINLNSFN